ncbi:hypothetical protein [Chryseobacterium indoltheticum]|uniref:Uncharacterized protein n=1 Tax=Chryseobacterium indoltheticum TaxID=254 RepID=A0A381FBR6_9FLAO|nr:hypothetical protein [Chryseobacterium indoltheticum]AZA73554.1 hypothetical protein EG358_07210 [Chryseobacterium indoltheticum]SIR24574.1 hypothetical protein SAMN05421682_115102 [Chryseobacterium indoltheticum]SUX43492.1 Uncharacterised protein [Chryseobacterium indoltheticum]
MTTHEKAIQLINDLGIAPKNVAKIINKENPSTDAVYKKIKSQARNKFSVDDYENIKKHILGIADKLKNE